VRAHARSIEAAVKNGADLAARADVLLGAFTAAVASAGEPRRRCTRCRRRWAAISRDAWRGEFRC